MLLHAPLAPTFSFINAVNQAGSGSNTVITGAINTIGADLIVVWVAQYTAASQSTPTDNQGNSYSYVTSGNTAGNCRPYLYYKAAPVVSSSHTFTVPGVSNLFGNVTAAAFKNSAAAPYDKTGVNGTTSTTVTTNINPTLSDELIVTFCGTSNAAGSGTVDAAYTQPLAFSQGGGTNMGGGFGYTIQTTAVNAGPVWTFGSSLALSLMVSAFKSLRSH